MVDMRTVMVTDEMLAHATAQKLPGRCHVIGRQALRELGADAAVTVREMVLASPCVLAIGARPWDAMPLLQEMRLPYKVPVVLLTPEATRERTRDATYLDVFSIVPLDGSVSGLSSALSVECCLAWEWRRGRFQRGVIPPVLVRRREQRPEHQPRPVAILPTPEERALSRAGELERNRTGS